MKKAKLQGHKTVRVFGDKYVIRKINPFLDFAYDSMPQIFTYQKSNRPETEVVPHPATIQKQLKDMKAIVAAGIVEPKLEPVGKGEKFRHEAGITIDDLFVDMELGTRLYLEIIAHSLNKFRGIRSLFFSIATRWSLFTEWRRNMDKSPLPSSSPTETTP